MNKNILLPIIGIVVVLGIIAGIFFGVQQSALPDANLETRYPSPENYVYTPVKGFLQCVKSGADYSFPADGTVGTLMVAGTVENLGDLYQKYGYYRYVSCPADVKTDCKVTLDYTACDANYVGKFRTGSNAWSDFVEGQSVTLKPSSSPYLVQYYCGCRSGAICFGSGSKYVPRVSVYFTPTAIQLTDYESFLTSGIIEGTSPYCRFIGAEAEIVKEMQKVDANLGVQELTFLSPTVPIVSGWKKLDFIEGGVSPLGKYKDKDVICKPKQGLYYLDFWKTVGGVNYYKQGLPALSDSLMKNTCCGYESNMCPTGMVCSEYQCVQKSAVCPTGEEQCSTPFNVKQDRIYEDGKWFLKTTNCVDGCTDTSKVEVCCSETYCSKFGLQCALELRPPNCDKEGYKSGCYDIKPPKQDCPAGSCCYALNPDYKEQACPTSQTCCPADDGDNDPLKGVCKVGTCGTIPEDCFKIGDEDNDGVADDKDPECWFCVLNDDRIERLNPKDCCAAKGDRWVVEYNLIGVKDKEYCLECGIWNSLTMDECGGGGKAALLGFLVAIGAGIALFIVLDGSKYGGQKNRAKNIALSIVAGVIAGVLIYWLVSYIASKWYWILGILGVVALLLIIVKVVLKR